MSVQGHPSAIARVIELNEKSLVEEWLADMRSQGLEKYGALAEPATQFVRSLRDATAQGELSSRSPAFDDLMRSMVELSRERARAGSSPRETALLVFSFKKPLLRQLRAASKDADELAQSSWQATELLDSLGLATTEAAAKAREEVILRQQQEMLELSTPVVKLWDGILALPLIGTLDSARTQVVMETLLTTITQSGATIAILDITGVPTVDTLTAQHLIKTVTAARLMGAECIISGIRPQIAQTIVHLGVELGDITTKATLADAFAAALKRTGAKVVRADAKPPGASGRE